MSLTVRAEGRGLNGSPRHRTTVTESPRHRTTGTTKGEVTAPGVAELVMMLVFGALGVLFGIPVWHGRRAAVMVDRAGVCRTTARRGRSSPGRCWPESACSGASSDDG
ncbi:hypothetical protein OG229_37290 [Streptomyces platensis]|uniref:hypothetical protein n=1 Tax=Streptomyces platensis TaxID=58346 RepID=UPI002E127594|nr:hypothetical protein OG229_37290 [Streptomyces platensis]